MFKRLVLCMCVLACLLPANGLLAQSVFYSNTIDDNFFSPVGREIAMPIAFTGSYEVDSFSFGYFLPLDSPNGDSTDAIVNFYTAAQPLGDAFSGFDNDNGFYPNLVSSTRISNLGSDPSGATNIVNVDLTPLGNFFEWDAMLLATGETGGWVSIQFTNPDAGWENATGDSQDDVFQDMTDGSFQYFGGTPQAAFNIELSGQNLTPQDTPEPGVTALLVGLALPGGLVFLRRRRNRRR